MVRLAHHVRVGAGLSMTTKEFYDDPRKNHQWAGHEFLAEIDLNSSGRITMGVYPLLADETCYFLAADFDKQSWMEDRAAFLKTCRSFGLPAALERSRSGQGGHVWIFFEEPLPALLARKMGSALLTFTLEKRHQIGLDSYDRFFPNQDTLPKGGFGNLIALPLQKRNDLIFDDLINTLEQGRSPLFLTERTEHVDSFAERLRKFAKNVIVLKGGMGRKQRLEVIGQIKSISEGEERVLLATGRYIGEGFDDARLDTLFLALPISWHGTLQQYVGRLHRLHDQKKVVQVYDYADLQVPMLRRMYEKRLKGYRAIGYSVAEAG